jgi:hypothetical protein
LVYLSDSIRIWKIDRNSVMLVSRMAVSGKLTWASLILVLSMAASAGATSLPFIYDDFAKARSEAIERGLPLFVECWAPW